MEEYKSQIISFYQKYRRMPGYQEIMRLTGFKSKNAVYKLINRLVEAGIVSKDTQGKITPSRSFDEVPLLGLVEAGIPSVAEADAVTEMMSLDDYLIDRQHQAATYILEVKGDSMIEAGINDGDLVIVERQAHAKEGEIVIAEVDGGWTMKYFKTKNGQPYLLPANKNYQAIYPESDLRIAAIVRGVVRKY